MSESSLPSFIRGRRAALAKEEAVNPETNPADPEVVAFLTKVKGTNAENKALRQENEALKLDRDRDLGRINWLQQELHRVAGQRNGYQRAYAEQKAEIAILITAAAVACDQSLASVKAAFDQFLKASDSALRAIKENLVAEGVDPIEPKSGQSNLSDAQLQQIGQRFGANSRPEEDVHSERYGNDHQEEHK